MKHYYDMRVKPMEFEVGTWVYCYSPRKYQGRSPKWAKNYGGPYLIIRKIGAVNVVLQQSRRSKAFVVHIDKIKKCLGETPPSWLVEEKSDAECTPIEIANVEVDRDEPEVVRSEVQMNPPLRLYNEQDVESELEDDSVLSEVQTYSPFRLRRDPVVESESEVEEGDESELEGMPEYEKVQRRSSVRTRRPPARYADFYMARARVDW
jgi:hypothetical protein